MIAFLNRLMESGEIDFSFMVSHRLPFEKAAEGYRIFDRREENAVKVLLLPHPQTQTAP
jgi:threonine dehydrogenase-like Zn-dependent dehydrogenase